MAKRTRITRPYPTQQLQDVLPIAETIQRVNGGLPVTPDMLADATGTSRKSSSFIQKLNSSAKYGLTKGSHADEFVELTDLGESITAPKSAEERVRSVFQAALRPDVFRGFYETYSGKRMPEDRYATATIVRELGVRSELADECLLLIRRNGVFAGVISDQSGVLIVAPTPPTAAGEAPDQANSLQSALGGDGSKEQAHILVVSTPADPTAEAVLRLLRGWSVSVSSVHLDPSSADLIPRDLAASLDTAGGCVFIWPAGDNGGTWTGDLQCTGTAHSWAAMGAVAYRLDHRVVVVSRGSGGPQSMDGLGSPRVTTIQPSQEEDLYLRLVPALIQSGIVTIAVG